MENHCGKQTVGCEVTSCCHNKRGCECDLETILVRPACNCHSGEQNESLCGSYCCKN